MNSSNLKSCYHAGDYVYYSSDLKECPICIILERHVKKIFRLKDIIKTYKKNKCETRIKLLSQHEEE